jgi:hypothetical protein
MTWHLYQITLRRSHKNIVKLCTNQSFRPEYRACSMFRVFSSPSTRAQSLLDPPQRDASRAFSSNGNQSLGASRVGVFTSHVPVAGRSAVSFYNDRYRQHRALLNHELITIYTIQVSVSSAAGGFMAVKVLWMYKDGRFSNSRCCWDNNLHQQ